VQQVQLFCTQDLVFFKLHYSTASAISVVLCDYCACSVNVFVPGDSVLQYNTLQYSTIKYSRVQ
jgi:hypothetical protein